MQVEGQHDESLLLLMATGARVRNAYPTFPLPGNSPLKDGLMPYVVRRWHQICTKDFIGMGWGCVGLGSRRGNGPPSRRSLGVLRGRSPTLVLRHGPDSYGRQQ